MQEFSVEKTETTSPLGSVEQVLQAKQTSIDESSYLVGEVPQVNLLDPQAFLPLNSDQLVGAVNILEKTLVETQELIAAEMHQIQKNQKKIYGWEDRIEKNKVVIEKNLAHVKQNLTDIAYDKKNRDYWVGRSEQVLLDFSHAEASSREADWAWLVKKYGLKNPDGTEIDPRGSCAEEICEGAIQNLSGEYQVAANKYEQAKKEKELHNVQRIQENARLTATNEKLQGFIQNIYRQEIEPLQDGVLLLKELSVKLKALEQQKDATYGDLRMWAEGFLDEFLRLNPKTPQMIVTEFRRLTSLPLPSENS